VKRLGLTFDVGSDANQAVVNAFGVQNPDTQELALHAVYILGQDGTIFYRKIGRRRPVSAELIDAIDAFKGNYPQSDRIEGQPPRKVAYPSNNFQTIIEMATTPELPASISTTDIETVLTLIHKGASSDVVLIAYRRFIAGAQGTSEEDLLATANWIARQRFIADKPAAIEAGLDLHRRLKRLDELEAALLKAESSDGEDQRLHQLAAARGGLAKARATIVNNAQAWLLEYAQGSLRGYREVARER
jgi:hypothetical protein